ncbi:MAG: TMEM165/GDT1 family protein [Methylococcus sp.]|nr:MAG: TMEM165/GDT1 family protein [Methylococcus sp.]
MPCPIFHSVVDPLYSALFTIDSTGAIRSVGASALLVAAAEMGDKSQLVAMALASRHRHWPVFLGATLAFALLNAIAVLFGSIASHWLPAPISSLLVAGLFILFGLRYVFDPGKTADEIPKEERGHGVLVTTFLMIFLAELGDKTQFAVAGLGASEPPFWVWVGSTIGLSITSGLGIWVGRIIYRRVSTRMINRCAGFLFLIFAGYALHAALRGDELHNIWSSFDVRGFNVIRHDEE